MIVTNDPRGPAARDALAGASVVHVALSGLRSGDSPRFVPVHEEYARALAAAGDDLHPILVHDPSMRIIDGVQRVRAAQMRGQTTIRARLLVDDDPYVVAVAVNIDHGLPLSRAERTAAAMRILSAHPDWSDRAIARICGVNGKTIAVLRHCATEAVPRLHKRVGQDGRARPVDNSEGRRIARRVLTEHPDASLRWVASIAGVAPNTVRRVRESMAADDPSSGRSRGHAAGAEGDGASSEWSRQEAVAYLKKDPSLRMKDSGRKFLHWISTHGSLPDECDAMMSDIPSHCTDLVARLALDCSQWWRFFAEELLRRGGAENHPAR